MITGRLLEAVAEADGITFVGAYSRDGARAAAYSSDHGAARSWSDLDALLADAAVDAVYVASPNSLHADHAQAALSAGKHVLLEKPATATSSAWNALTDLARARRVVLLEAMRSAYDPGMATVRSLLPRLGTLRRVSLSYAQRSSRYDQVLAGKRVNIFDPAMGGGALMDLGVYCVSAMVQLLGAPDEVVAAQVPLPSGVDGAGAALAVYPGLVADLAWSKITTSSAPCEIQGEMGSLVFDSVTAPRRIGLTLLDGSTESIAVDAPEWNLVYEVERFVAGVNGADLAGDHRRTRITQEVLEALHEMSSGRD